MLVYSRPKGTYNASKADHVLVDWYLANAELGDGKFSLKANVSGPGIEGDGRSLKITVETLHAREPTQRRLQDLARARRQGRQGGPRRLELDDANDHHQPRRPGRSRPDAPGHGDRQG